MSCFRVARQEARPVRFRPVRSHFQRSVAVVASTDGDEIFATFDPLGLNLFRRLASRKQEQDRNGAEREEQCGSSFVHLCTVVVFSWIRCERGSAKGPVSRLNGSGGRPFQVTRKQRSSRFSLLMPLRPELVSYPSEFPRRLRLPRTIWFHAGIDSPADADRKWTERSGSSGLTIMLSMGHSEQSASKYGRFRRLCVAQTGIHHFAAGSVAERAIEMAAAQHEKASLQSGVGTRTTPPVRPGHAGAQYRPLGCD